MGVAVDRHGIGPDSLGEALAARPALVYLQPTVHSPTGVASGPARRRRIAVLLADARVPLVEDLALADLSWDAGAAPDRLARPRRHQRAVVGSLASASGAACASGSSGPRSPWPCARPGSRPPRTWASSAVSQVLAERALQASDEPAGRRALTDELSVRHRALTGALRSSLPAWSWVEPAGGLSLWVRIGTDGAAFARTARRHGVVVAGPEPLGVTSHPDHIRLAFAAPAPVLIEAVSRLCDAWHDRGP